MTSSGAQRLSDAQKQCLRRVGAGYEAKQIARDLGISPNAVNERLRNARRILGVSSSREAARLLASAEQSDDYKRLVANPLGVASDLDFVPNLSPSNTATESAGIGPGGVTFREAQAVYLASVSAAGSWFPWPVRTPGRNRNDLTIGQTALVILVLTISLAAAALVAIALVDQLSHFHLR